MILEYGGARTLFGVCQQQLLAVTRCDKKVFGDWESVGWKQLVQTAKDIVDAISIGFCLDPAAFQLRLFNRMDGTVAQVGLDVTAVANSQGDLAIEQKAVIGLAVQYFLGLLQGTSDSKQGDWLSVKGKLDVEVVSRLESFAVDYLSVYGGKTIHVPMGIVVDDQTLRLNGSFAAKPPLPRLPSAIIEVCGLVAGLRSTRKDVSILMDAGDEMDTGCDPDRFASRLRDAIHTSRRFRFFVAVGKDARGRDERILLDVEEIEASAKNFLT